MRPITLNGPGETQACRDPISAPTQSQRPVAQPVVMTPGNSAHELHSQAALTQYDTEPHSECLSQPSSAALSARTTPAASAPEMSSDTKQDGCQHDMPEPAATPPLQPCDTHRAAQDCGALCELLLQQSDRLRSFEERHFDLNCLEPVLLALIGSLDRHQDELRRLASVIACHDAICSEPVVGCLLNSVRGLLETECIRLQNTLMSLGVASYQALGNTFDPSTQHCTKRDMTDDAAMVMHISERLYPGYRRHGRIIRPECVSVFKKAPE